jgi:hypothetical protein
VLEALQKQNAEQTALLTSLADGRRFTTMSAVSLIDRIVAGWRADSDRQHAETLETVRLTAQEQVPYNVQTVRPSFDLSLV